MTGSDPRLQGLVLPFEGRWPKVAPDVFLAPGVVVVGDVEIGAGSSIWYNCVLRADVASISIGQGTNIQDGSVVHVTGGKFSTEIGDDVLIGHMAMIHGCRLMERAFVGMKATVLDGVVVEPDAMVAAGALVSPNKVVRSGELWAGAPARKMRDLAPEEIERHREAVRRYAGNARRHMTAIAEVAAGAGRG